MSVAASAADGRGGAGGARVTPIRAIALAAALLLAICAMLALWEFSESGPAPGRGDPAPEAALVAARLDGDAAAARAALEAARESLRRAPATPLDAVELAVRAGRPSLA